MQLVPLFLEGKLVVQPGFEGRAERHLDTVGSEGERLGIVLPEISDSDGTSAVSGVDRSDDTVLAWCFAIAGRDDQLVVKPLPHRRPGLVKSDRFAIDSWDLEGLSRRGDGDAVGQLVQFGKRLRCFDDEGVMDPDEGRAAIGLDTFFDAKQSGPIGIGKMGSDLHDSPYGTGLFDGDLSRRVRRTVLGPFRIGGDRATGGVRFEELSAISHEIDQVALSVDAEAEWPGIDRDAVGLLDR